jgi:hypothetical protein
MQCGDGEQVSKLVSKVFCLHTLWDTISKTGKKIGDPKIIIPQSSITESRYTFI